MMKQVPMPCYLYANTFQQGVDNVRKTFFLKDKMRGFFKILDLLSLVLRRC